MARIETEMTGGKPRIIEIDGRWGRYALILQTTSGTLYLELIPMQGRELADLLTAEFGESKSPEEFQAEVQAEVDRRKAEGAW